MDEYINDVDKDFRLCIKLENLLSMFYYVSVVISLIICIKFNDILCITLIIIHVLYIIAEAINDIIFKNFAENERRKTLLSNAWKIELTDNWKERGAKDRDYAILTDEIYKSTFNMNTAQYKELKGISNTKGNKNFSQNQIIEKNNGRIVMQCTSRQHVERQAFYYSLKFLKYRENAE